MIDNCLSCKINYKLSYNKGSHKLVNFDMICPLCNYTGSHILHDQNDEADLAGESIECCNCNSYIIYTMGSPKIWKDEFYIDNYCVIREFRDNTTTIIYNDKLIATLSSIIEFKDKKQFTEKLKTILVFS